MNETITRVLAGDTAAYRQIVRECGPMVRAYLAGHLRDPHQVEDVSQEIFIAAYWSLESFDPKLDFRVWLKAIARNKLMSHLRRQYTHKNSVNTLTVEIHEMLLPELDRCNPDAEAVVDRLRECVAKHPERDRQLIEARYFNDEPVNAIAGRLKTTVTAISSQLFRIRGQLRTCVETRVAL